MLILILAQKFKVCIIIYSKYQHIKLLLDCFLIAESFTTYGVGRVRIKIRQHLENN